jgi:carbon-monoxide dehydrogenase small subunit
VTIALRLNGPLRREVVEPNETLLDFLRGRLGLTGTKSSCEVQVCGACTVLVDGLPVSSCCYLASEADGREVTTVEGLTGEDVDRLRSAFVRHGAGSADHAKESMAPAWRAAVSWSRPPTGAFL